MRKLITIMIILLFGAAKAWAFSPVADTVKQPLSIVSDSLKGPIYTYIARSYLHFDTLKSKKKRQECQDKALDFTMQALHYYSKYNDTTGMRISFYNLAKVYHAQRKYAQAKWFILEADNFSRQKNDVPNLINSLLELAAIKSDIKDYDLAMRDLNEALVLSVNNHYTRNESAVQESFAILYTRTQDYTKAAAALKRHNTIDDNIRKSEEAALIAKARANDTLQNKKKLVLSSTKKLAKSGSPKKTVSL
jgi:tetratricopeptide (TPR) repeat protein